MTSERTARLLGEGLRKPLRPAATPGAAHARACRGLETKSHAEQALAPARLDIGTRQRPSQVFSRFDNVFG